MDALVIFSSDNTHPLSFLLNKQRRHVWCAIKDEERGHWISYNWSQGIPELTCLATSDFDLKTFFEDQGLEVLETVVGDTPPHGPLQWNNCVGHVKTILAIHTYALVPNGLYKHLTRRRKPMLSFLRKLSFVPGFGGSKTVYLPPTEETKKTTTTTAKKADTGTADELAQRKKVQIGSESTSEDSGSGSLLTKKAY